MTVKLPPFIYYSVRVLMLQSLYRFFLNNGSLATWYKCFGEGLGAAGEGFGTGNFLSGWRLGMDCSFPPLTTSSRTLLWSVNM